jgi:UrcA family protein
MFPCCRSAMLGTRSALLAVVALTMLGPAGACKASEEPASKAKYDVIGKSVVRMGDLNLQKPADARALLQRLDRAAYQACGGDPKFHSSYSMTPRRVIEAFEECRTEAVRRTVEQIGHSTLTRVYADSRAPASRTSEQPVAARVP